MAVAELAAMAVWTGKAADSPILKAGIVAAALCALFAVVSAGAAAGAAAIDGARRGTGVRAGDCVRRAALSAATVGVISRPALFGCRRLVNRLSGREGETWGSFLRGYELATVICCGITHLPNRWMLFIVHLCTYIKITEKRIAENAVYNREKLASLTVFTPGSHIENQSCWQNVRFGLSTMAYSGCEIMAVHNALLAMGRELSIRDMAELISAFERKGAALCGIWGCSAYALRDFLRRYGYEAAFTCSRDVHRINALAEKYNTFVVMVYNNRYDIRSMIHTVTVTRDRRGKYTIHNAYKKNGAGEYAAYAGDGKIESLQKAMELISRFASPLSVIGVGKA